MDKLLNRMAGWWGRLLSHDAKSILIKSCLSIIPIYLLSFIKFPKWAIKLINSHLARYLCDGSEDRHKFYLANCESVNMLNEYGDFGYSKFEGPEYLFAWFMD